MSWQEEMNEIRSAEFDASLNVVSSTDGFFQAVSQHPTVQKAFGDLLMGESQEEVLGLIHDLAHEPIDWSFENPNDASLAVLLWMTIFSYSSFAHVAATYVDKAPQCWYAKKLAQRVLHPPRSDTENYTFAQTTDEASAIGSDTRGIRLPRQLMTDEVAKTYGDTVSILWSSEIDVRGDSEIQVIGSVGGDQP